MELELGLDLMVWDYLHISARLWSLPAPPLLRCARVGGLVFSWGSQHLSGDFHTELMDSCTVITVVIH